MSFVHLHCHSEFSLLDGANRIDDLIRRAQEFEQPAVAITDHGNLHAAWEFQEHARAAGIKPIIGMEAYVAPGDRRARGRSTPTAKPYYHLVLLARDAIGYRNLVKLSSLAYTEGFYSRPRVDRELLAKYNEGIIVSSACLAGEVAQHLMADDQAAAREAASWYAELFKDRYYLEVQAHDSEGQATLNPRVFALAKELGLPVIATNDAHFLRSDDHDAHDVLLCIGLGKDRSDPDRMRYDRGLYFKSAPEMAKSFPDRPDVLENTLRIADQINVEFGKKYHLPAFPLPAGVATENDLLTTLALAGAKERYGDPLPANVRERFDYELGVITKTGYAGYFLIVADFIKAARDRGIPVGPGRGSAAGSLVAYSLRITDVDPLFYDLLFERFLNPERVSMPDVDVDFCFERRGEVIEYVRQKYGRESVCQIVTFGTMKSRAAIKDVGRTLGFTPAETDSLAKLIPNQPNFSLTVKEAIEKLDDVGRLYRTDERYRQLLDYAAALEGLSRHTGVHAAGVVIAPGPVDDYVPICTQSTKGSGSVDEEQVIVSQYDMNCLEHAGMLKMDFLGLTTLTVLHDALAAIEQRHGKAPDLNTIPMDDPLVYSMLRAGRTVGVFQFESPLATDLLRGMRCDRFDDLVASNALMRPGPLDAGMHRVYQRRKRGEEPVSYALPELQQVLEPTYGVITYQEQVMRIAQLLAGISLAEADVLRKAVGKKDAELIRVELGKFVEKAVARGYDRRIIEELAGQIETFGRYGFNKSHSVAYSVISYHTAWLKVHYPAEFMAALLSSSIGDTDSVVKFINEARELGIEVLAPDVNESGYKFTVVGDKRIRFGLGAIRNVGRSAIDSMLAARAEKPFASLYDFCERVDLRLCNKRVIEAMIASGALDNLGGHRAQYWAVLDTALAEASLKQQEAAVGQFSLLGGVDESTSVAKPRVLPNIAPLGESERLTKEKEILGFYISGHPLEPFRVECELFATHTVSELGKWTDQPLSLGVVVTAVKRQISRKSGAEFARLTVEDFSGSSEVLVFPEAWSMLADRVKTDIPVLLKGSYSRRDQDADNPTFIVESLTPLVEKRLNGEVAVAIDLQSGDSLTPDVMRDVRVVVETHATANVTSPPLEVQWIDGSGSRARLKSRSLKLAASQAALRDLRQLLGEDRVRVVRSGGGGSGGGGTPRGTDVGTSATLDFEKPIVELEKQIDELKRLAGGQQLDVNDEIAPLERKLADLRDEIYKNLSPWQRVQVARSAKRPFTLDYIQHAFTDFIELHGDRAFREDAAIVGGWARLDGETIMVVGHQRGRDTKEILKRNFGMPHPEGYRKALRLMKLAEKFSVPVITFIDTMGAWAGLGAEERGQSEAIARNLFEMSRLEVPIIATVIGEGGSGGALALGVSDRTNMLENAVYSVITVEGCASILWKDGKSQELREKAASALRITAQDLQELRVIDEIIPEPPGGAHSNHEAAAANLHDTLVRQLEDLRRYKPDKLVRRRREKFMRIGQYLE